MGICLSEEEEPEHRRYPFSIGNSSSEPVYIVIGDRLCTIPPYSVHALPHSCNYGLVVVDEVIPLVRFKRDRTPLVDGRMAYLYGDNLTIADLRRVTTK